MAASRILNTFTRTAGNGAKDKEPGTSHPRRRESRESHDRTVPSGRLVRRMVDAALLVDDGPHLLADLLIGQTEGQIRAFDAFTGTPTLSILTSRAGNEAAGGRHPGGAAPRPSGSRHAADEDEMQIVYAMEVIDPLERPNGARYVGRFTYETHEQAWAKYSEAIRFGFEAYIEKVGRMRVTSQTSAHEHLSRSSVAARRAPR
jgi:hypothetical protein